MGGVDKLALEAGGATLLDRVLAAARPRCRRLVVVGPPRPTSVSGVSFRQERAPGGGPLPAVLAGVEELGDDVDVALVLAGDLALVTTSVLDRLLAVLHGDPAAQAAAARDDRGAPNPLLAAYRGNVLRDAAERGCRPGQPARQLLPDAVAVVDLGAEATLNVNRPADLRRARALLAAATGLPCEVRG